MDLRGKLLIFPQISFKITSPINTDKLLLSFSLFHFSLPTLFASFSRATVLPPKIISLNKKATLLVL